MQLEAEKPEQDGLDDYDRARAAEMDERPIYVTINVTVNVVLTPRESREPEQSALVESEIRA